MARSSQRSKLLSLLILLLLPLAALGQFQFFEQMFGGGGGGQPRAQHAQQQSPRGDVGSDSAWYRQVYGQARCSKYLCAATLSCVDKPAHCPCAWPAHEDKVELDDGLAVCASKGGFKAGEMARKVELARKGLL